MTTQKSIFCSFYLLMNLFASTVLAAAPSNDEKALYALSSLRLHLEDQLSDQSISPSSTQIHFDESDVSLLWQRAAESSLASDILEAKQYYEETPFSTHNDRKANFLKAKTLVENAWSLLNPFLPKPLDPLLVIPKGNAVHRFQLTSSDLEDRLNRIFKHSGVIENDQNFANAGFSILCQRSSKMIVAKHKKIHGYLIKTYLLSDKPFQTWKWMSNRCLGAENIRNLIESKKLTCFIVPDKWIYPLPDSAVDNETEISERTSPAVLVVTHMNIVDREASREAWRTKITKKHLRELYCILSHGFASTYLVQNIPYTKEGKFACLDTEYPFRQHRLDRVKHLLSDEMKDYWDVLVKTGGNP